MSLDQLAVRPSARAAGQLGSLRGLSQPGVDAAVRAAVDTLAAAGADVRPVSVPGHRNGGHLWGVIGTDGTFNQLIEGNGYGLNVPGRYDSELIEHLARGLREHAAELSVTLKLTTVLGRYNLDRHGNRYYAMARNLALDLAAAYDAALAEVGTSWSCRRCRWSRSTCRPGRPTRSR
jgi:amidase